MEGRAGGSEAWEGERGCPKRVDEGGRIPNTPSGDEMERAIGQTPTGKRKGLAGIGTGEKQVMGQAIRKSMKEEAGPNVPDIGVGIQTAILTRPFHLLNSDWKPLTDRCLKEVAERGGFEPPVEL